MKFENFFNKQVEIKFSLVANLVTKQIWLRKLEVIVGPRIHLGINPFLVQISDEQKDIRVVSICIMQVINVLNRYVKSNHEYKHLTLSPKVVICKANCWHLKY